MSEPKMLKVLHIPADRKQDATFKLFEDKLGVLQKAVGGWIEPVHLRQWAFNANLLWHPMLLVNEEGLLHGLPPNLRATRLYHGGLIQMNQSPIVGEAYLLAETEDVGLGEWKWTSLPDDFKPEMINGPW